MHDTMIAFLFAAATVVLAEMGDKTQLLAMAFAAKYKPAMALPSGNAISPWLM